jgi:hypothetical protein
MPFHALVSCAIEALDNPRIQLHWDICMRIPSRPYLHILAVLSRDSLLFLRQVDRTPHIVKNWVYRICNRPPCLVFFLFPRDGFRKGLESVDFTSPRSRKKDRETCREGTVFHSPTVSFQINIWCTLGYLIQASSPKL